MEVVNFFTWERFPNPCYNFYWLSTALTAEQASTSLDSINSLDETAFYITYYTCAGTVVAGMAHYNIPKQKVKTLALHLKVGMSRDWNSSGIHFLMYCTEKLTKKERKKRGPKKLTSVSFGVHGRDRWCGDGRPRRKDRGPWTEQFPPICRHRRVETSLRASFN